MSINNLTVINWVVVSVYYLSVSSLCKIATALTVKDSYKPGYELKFMMNLAGLCFAKSSSWQNTQHEVSRNFQATNEGLCQFMSRDISRQTVSIHLKCLHNFKVTTWRAEAFWEGPL